MSALFLFMTNGKNCDKMKCIFFVIFWRLWVHIYGKQRRMGAMRWVKYPYRRWMQNLIRHLIHTAKVFFHFVWLDYTVMQMMQKIVCKKLLQFFIGN